MNSFQCRLCNWLRRSVFERLCGQLLFNEDMSRELDLLLEENERLSGRNQQLETPGYRGELS